MLDNMSIGCMVYDVVRYSFEGDTDISKYCDLKDEKKSTDELSKSICLKLLDYSVFSNGQFNSLIVDGKLVGYYYTCGILLVSFCVRKEFRNAEILKEVFEEIREDFKTDFYTYMWKRNTRGINWLKKCGMEEVESEIKDSIKLKYKICHSL